MKTMNQTRRGMVIKSVGMTLLVLVPRAATGLADDFEIDWHTIDGGGEMWSAGGDYELGGTIGQPDANELVMTGGNYVLAGGFWAGAGAVCACPADVNSDGRRDGEDIDGFVACLVAAGANCACADLDGSGALDMQDISLFVTELLIGDVCP